MLIPIATFVLIHQLYLSNGDFFVAFCITVKIIVSFFVFVIWWLFISIIPSFYNLYAARDLQNSTCTQVFYFLVEYKEHFPIINQ